MDRTSRQALNKTTDYHEARQQREDTVATRRSQVTLDFMKVSLHGLFRAMKNTSEEASLAKTDEMARPFLELT